MTSRTRRRAVGSVPDAVITPAATAGISSNSSTPTFALTPSARTGKWLIILASSTSSGGAATDATGLTLNGTALRPVIQFNDGRSHVSIWITDSDVACDGTDEVIATFGQTMGGGGTGGNATQMGLYAADNLLSTTEIDTASSDGNPASLNMNVLAGSVAVGVTSNFHSTTPVWTGMSASGNDFEKNGGTGRLGGQDQSFAAAQTPATISVTTGGTSDSASVAAAFR